MNHQAVNRSRRAVVGVLFAVLVATGLTGCGGNADATTLTLEPVNTETANPFMANIGTDQAGITPPISVLVAMEDGLGGINLNQPVEIGGVTSNVTVRGTIKINGDVSATSTSEVAGQTCVSTITGQGVRASR